MKKFKRTAVVLATVLLLVAAALGWLLGSHSGLRFTLACVERATDGALQVQKAQGKLAGPLILDGVRYRDADSGLVVQVARLQLDLHPAASLLGQLHLLRVRIEQVDVTLPTHAATTTSQRSAAVNLRAPFSIVLEQVQVSHVRVHRGTRDVFVADSLDLAGTWTGKHIKLRQLHLRAPNGQVNLDGTLSLGNGYPGHGQLHFDWMTASTRWAGNVQARNDGHHVNAKVVLTRPSAARMQLELAPHAPYTWQAKLVLPRAAVAPWLGNSSSHQFATTLDAQGDQHRASAHGTLDLDNNRMQLTALDARLTKDYRQLILDRLQLTSPQHQGTLEGQGRIHLHPVPQTAQLKLQWRDVVLPIEQAGKQRTSQGALTFNGSTDRYQASLQADVETAGKTSHLQAQLHGSSKQLTIESLRVQQPHGKLDAHGELHWQPQPSWRFQASAKAFDPGLLLAGWNGTLDAALSTDGRFTDNNLQASLQLKNLDGTLRQHRVSGHGNLHLSANKIISGSLQLRADSSVLQVAGRKGSRNDVELNLNAASLADWLPQAHGALQARLQLRGLWPQLGIRGNLHGQKLAWGDQHAARLTLNFDVADISHPDGTLSLQAGDVDVAGFAFNKLDVDGHGNRRQHRLQLQAEGNPLSLHLALTGDIQGDTWKGRLQRFDLGLAGTPDWRLRAPSTMVWNRGQGSLGEACLSPGKALLCVSAERQRDSRLHMQYRIHELPLELIMALTGNRLPIRASGTLNGNGDIRRTASGKLLGEAAVTSTQSKIFYPDQPQRPLIRFRNLDANLALTPQQQRLRIGALLQQNGRLDGDLQMNVSQQALGGHLRMQLDNLHFIELFTSEVANLKGSLQAELALAGTLQQPKVNGQAMIDGFSGEIPGLGLNLQQGHLRLSTNNDQQLRIDGQVHSGEGTLQISGNAGIGAGNVTNIRLRGDKVQVAEIPSATVSVSPNLNIRHDAEGVHIGGTVRVDKADVKLEKLPGAGATKASPDVVVVDTEKSSAQATGMPINSDIHIDLGEQVHALGYGLNGNLYGKLQVTSSPGKSALGQGQIRIDGSFRAYSHELHIEQGQLLFAATPLDNPGLSIRAVRKLNPNATVDDGQVVGLQVRGTAKHPQLTVFSNPLMEQSDALSYLITGKPLSQAKGGEGSMINSAAQALGSAVGDLLAKNIGSKLGISNIGVSSNDALGTSAFTVGKYLSPRLYLSYAVGLFQPGQVVTLRYILSRRWNFEAQQASEFNRTSFNYRYEH